MHEAIRIFREINDFYTYRYDNDSSKTWFELMTASQHSSTNNGQISTIERCIELLNGSRAELPFVIDVLNEHDLLPNIDPDAKEVLWIEKKAGLRLAKCINCLEKGLLEEGKTLMTEVVTLFNESNSLRKKYNCEHTYLYDLSIDSNVKHIHTINTCHILLTNSIENLPFVIDVFKGRDILPDLTEDQSYWNQKKGLYTLCKSVNCLKKNQIAEGIRFVEDALLYLNKADSERLIESVKKQLALLNESAENSSRIIHDISWRIRDYDKYIAKAAIDNFH